MSKAFLSHSSRDKEFVRPVADELGSALSHYDERTFEPTSESAGEILEALSNSTIFVLFLSKSALASPWVKQEIRYAQHMYFEGKIKQVAIFPLDDTTRDALDLWLRPFVIQILKKPKLVALRIRSMLAMEETPHSRRFVGRDKQVSDLKDSLRDQSSNRPSAVLVSGIQGIGRRRLLSRAYQDLYPFLPNYWIEIYLGAYEGESALYERLLDYFEPNSTWVGAKEKADLFITLTPKERTSKIAEILSSVEASKQVVLLNFVEDAFNTDGNLEPWLLGAIRATKSNYPVLAVVTSRGPSPRALANLSDIPYLKLHSIEDKYAKQLLELLCEDLSVKAPDALFEQVNSLVGGHPGLLELSAKLIKAAGITRFKIELSSSDEKSALEEYVEKAIQNISLSLVERSAILLLEELGGATREDILHGFSEQSSGSEFSASLAKLLDFGLIEDAGGELRSASHLRLIMRRWKNDKKLQEILIPVRQKLVEILDEALSLEGGTYLSIRAPIAAAIRADGDFSNVLVSKPLLAAQQLRVARRLYDERSLVPAAEKARKAFENQLALSDEGVVEALRILGLVGARTADTDLKDFACRELNMLKGDKAKRISAFINGFERRLSGEFREAEQQLRVALGVGGNGDFHVLRELAASLLEQGKTQEAEKFARGALRIAPTNPYVLDILAACLIDRFRETPNDTGLERELEELLKRLVTSDEREHQSFSKRRKIAFLIVKRDYPGAWALLERESNSSHKTWYKLLAAECFFKQGDPRSALDQLEGLHRPPSGLDDESVVQFSQIRRLRILSLADAGRLDEAVSEFDTVGRFLEPKYRDSLRKELVVEIANSTASKSDAVIRFGRQG